MGIWPMGRRPARKHSVLARPGPTCNAPCPGWPGPLVVPVHGPPPQHAGRPGPARREQYQPAKARYPHTPQQANTITPQPSPTSTIGRRPCLHIYTRRWRPVYPPRPNPNSFPPSPAAPHRLFSLSSSPPLLRRLSPQIRRRHADPRLPFPSPVSRRCPSSAPRRRDS
jgi:hypothetical protein